MKYAAYLVLAVAFVVASPIATTADPKNDALWEKAMELHRKAIVIDAHSDLTSKMLDKNVDIGKRLPDGHQDIPRLFEGGMDAQFFSIYVAAKYEENGGPRRALEMMDSLYKALAKYPDKMELAVSTADIRRIVRQKKVAALMGLEGGHALEDSQAVLRMFYTLGIRYVTLTHSNTNGWADSSSDEATWGGLNTFGEAMIQEMNRIGMIVDISHVSDDTFWDVMRVSKAPVIASHSSSRTVAPMLRNMSDEMIKALAKNDGVIMINFGSAFVNTEWATRSNVVWNRIRTDYNGDLSRWREIWDSMKQGEGLEPATLDDLMAHFDHVIKITGVDSVGLGSDFDGVSNIPVGMDDVTKLPNITYELLKRGYSEKDVKKILGENLLRLFGEVEKVSAKMSAKKM